jgi:hypothetical protein
MFGSAKDLLPYVECSTPDGRGQVQECTDASVEAYPTWEFADGERMAGLLSFERLAENTGCEMPVE